MNSQELQKQLEKLKEQYRSVNFNVDSSWNALSNKLSSEEQDLLTVREIFLESPKKSFVMRYAPALIVLVIVFGGGITAVSASQQSVPGDVLYPLNRALEKIQEKAAITQKARIEFKVRMAEKRIEEVKKLKEINIEKFEVLAEQEPAEFEEAVLDAVDSYQEYLAEKSEKHRREEKVESWKKRIERVERISREIESEQDVEEEKEAIEEVFERKSIRSEKDGKDEGEEGDEKRERD